MSDFDIFPKSNSYEVDGSPQVVHVSTTELACEVEPIFQLVYSVARLASNPTSVAEFVSQLLR